MSASASTRAPLPSDDLPGLSDVEYSPIHSHAGWSIWKLRIPGRDTLTVDAWRSDPHYQVHTVEMPLGVMRSVVHRWVEGLVVETGA